MERETTNAENSAVWVEAIGRTLCGAFAGGCLYLIGWFCKDSTMATVGAAVGLILGLIYGHLVTEAVIRFVLGENR